MLSNCNTLLVTTVSALKNYFLSNDLPIYYITFEKKQNVLNAVSCAEVFHYSKLCENLSHQYRNSKKYTYSKTVEIVKTSRADIKALLDSIKTVFTKVDKTVGH